ncbi:MAG TPA: hypothetical protein DCW72_04590 [Elusimicrobia bacterium]|nr:MAG: hypothetical protein A2X29_01745 [Elusimicrobia bacterium GWA2_64_40]OGR63827.1 MAG: hypothetical protein A2X30_07640 [Elusimicrobia bacterium GWB2_63_16]HAN04892.1 hypothetical protein [Elusimicrobiota bacterium]HAU89521.1 hypothetical protein [Elusimicrobiota bacterium]
MGSKFVEKHKRKSLLAALLFIFHGRAKYVGILLILSVLSVPFVISGETFGRLVMFQPVAAFLRTVGLGSIVSAINPKYSNDLMKAALDRAASDSEQNSFWQKFLNSLNATLPPGGGPSSIAMIRGGGDDIFGTPELKDGGGRAKPGQVKGVVNEEERARGEGGDAVDLEGLLAGAGGPGADGGLYGDTMGQNLAGNFGNGSASGSGPYMNRTMLRGPGGAGGSASGMYARAVGQAASKVPVPGSPQKVNSKTMGRVSGFAWKNVGYKTKSARMDTKLGSKKPMFQLAETFGMTATAFKSKDAAYEYQASYTGSTYDGNDVSADALQTDTAAPIVPDTSFTGNLISGAGALQEDAKRCTDAQGTHGAAMSEDGKKIDDIAKTLGKPPKCCSGGVGAWNAKINNIVTLCNDFNVHEAQQAAACQITSKPMNCNSYSKMRIKPCSKWKCWLAIILMILLGGLFGIIGMIAVGVMIGGSVSGLFGPKMSGFVESIVSLVASGGEDKNAKDEASNPPPLNPTE